MLSIVVPTYKECENLKELIPELEKVLISSGESFEIVIVDDNSDDGTEALVEKLNLNYLTLIVRKTERGLSSAVHAGVLKAKGDIVCFMDADLSHPPEALKGMVQTILDGQADLVVGSRLVKGGGNDGWPLRRVFTSFVARSMAMPLTSVKDLTSGFFMFRREVYPSKSLNLSGFKIGLEVLVKGKYGSVREYPIVFQDRRYGESKLSGKIMIDYLKQLVELYLYKINPFRRK